MIRTRYHATFRRHRFRYSFTVGQLRLIPLLSASLDCARAKKPEEKTVSKSLNKLHQYMKAYYPRPIVYNPKAGR